MPTFHVPLLVNSEPGPTLVKLLGVPRVFQLKLPSLVTALFAPVKTANPVAVFKFTTPDARLANVPLARLIVPWLRLNTPEFSNRRERMRSPAPPEITP